MFLSDEQMAAVRHGTRGQPEPTYEWVDVPVGPQPIPEWVRGLEIRWMDGYACPPSYTIKVRPDSNVTDWPGKVYDRQGPRYLAESGDGRASCFYHGGEPELTQLGHRTRSLVGMMPMRGPCGRGDVVWGLSRGCYHDAFYYWDSPFDAWATPVDEGYGGHVFWVLLRDGRRVALRGPWHGAAPPGYQDVGTSKCGGLLLRDDLLVLLIARYYPHCRVARVNGRVQAVREDWDEPKAWVEAKRRGR